MLSFKKNLQATVVTLPGLVHLILTIVIICAVAFWNDANATIVRIVIVAAAVLIYFISNVDFKAKRENLKKYQESQS